MLVRHTCLLSPHLCSAPPPPLSACSQNRDRLYQFMWRPRLPSQLSADKEAEILKNLKVYTKKYDEEDEAMLMQVGRRGGEGRGGRVWVGPGGGW